MKHQKKAEGYIGRNVVSITMKMKIIVRIYQVKKKETTRYVLFSLLKSSEFSTLITRINRKVLDI